jgi:dCMP deaminase
VKDKYLRLWFNFAHDVAKLSHCDRLKVGCVLVSPDGERCLSFGYNGTYRGGPNEYHDTVPGDQRFIHAETNSLIKSRSMEPFSAVITDTPCYPCAMQLINANVVKVYASRPYRDLSGWELLREVLGASKVFLANP